MILRFFMRCFFIFAAAIAQRVAATADAARFPAAFDYADAFRWGLMPLLSMPDYFDFIIAHCRFRYFYFAAFLASHLLMFLLLLFSHSLFFSADIISASFHFRQDAIFFLYFSLRWFWLIFLSIISSFRFLLHFASFRLRFIYYFHWWFSALWLLYFWYFRVLMPSLLPPLFSHFWCCCHILPCLLFLALFFSPDLCWLRWFSLHWYFSAIWFRLLSDYAACHYFAAFLSLPCLRHAASFAARHFAMPDVWLPLFSVFCFLRHFSFAAIFAILPLPLLSLIFFRHFRFRLSFSPLSFHLPFRFLSFFHFSAADADVFVYAIMLLIWCCHYFFIRFCQICHCRHCCHLMPLSSFRCIFSLSYFLFYDIFLRAPIFRFFAAASSFLPFMPLRRFAAAWFSLSFAWFLRCRRRFSLRCFPHVDTCCHFIFFGFDIDFAFFRWYAFAVYYLMPSAFRFLSSFLLLRFRHLIASLMHCLFRHFRHYYCRFATAMPSLITLAISHYFHWLPDAFAALAAAYFRWLLWCSLFFAFTLKIFRRCYFFFDAATVATPMLPPFFAFDFSLIDFCFSSFFTLFFSMPITLLFAAASISFSPWWRCFWFSRSDMRYAARYAALISAELMLASPRRAIIAALIRAVWCACIIYAGALRAWRVLRVCMRLRVMLMPLPFVSFDVTPRCRFYWLILRLLPRRHVPLLFSRCAARRCARWYISWYAATIVAFKRDDAAFSVTLFCFRDVDFTVTRMLLMMLPAADDALRFLRPYRHACLPSSISSFSPASFSHARPCQIWYRLSLPRSPSWFLLTTLAHHRFLLWFRFHYALPIFIDAHSSPISPSPPSCLLLLAIWWCPDIFAWCAIAAISCCFAAYGAIDISLCRFFRFRCMLCRFFRFAFIFDWCFIDAFCAMMPIIFAIFRAFYDVYDAFATPFIFATHTARWRATLSWLPLAIADASRYHLFSDFDYAGLRDALIWLWFPPFYMLLLDFSPMFEIAAALLFVTFRWFIRYYHFSSRTYAFDDFLPPRSFDIYFSRFRCFLHYFAAASAIDAEHGAAFFLSLSLLMLFADDAISPLFIMPCFLFFSADIFSLWLFCWFIDDLIYCCFFLSPLCFFCFRYADAAYAWYALLCFIAFSLLSMLFLISITLCWCRHFLFAFARFAAVYFAADCWLFSPLSLDYFIISLSPFDIFCWLFSCHWHYFIYLIISFTIWFSSAAFWFLITPLITRWCCHCYFRFHFFASAIYYSSFFDYISARHFIIARRFSLRRIYSIHFRFSYCAIFWYLFTLWCLMFWYWFCFHAAIFWCFPSSFRFIFYFHFHFYFFFFFFFFFIFFFFFFFAIYMIVDIVTTSTTLINDDINWYINQFHH